MGERQKQYIAANSTRLPDYEKNHYFDNEVVSWRLLFTRCCDCHVRGGPLSLSSGFVSLAVFMNRFRFMIFIVKHEIYAVAQMPPMLPPHCRFTPPRRFIPFAISTRFFRLTS